MGEGLKKIAATMGGLIVKGGNAMAAYDAYGKPKHKKPKKGKAVLPEVSEEAKPTNENPYKEST
jgi:uncharacterized membrane protein YebE (DUF533 family)